MRAGTGTAWGGGRVISAQAGATSGVGGVGRRSRPDRRRLAEPWFWGRLTGLRPSGGRAGGGDSSWVSSRGGSIARDGSVRVASQIQPSTMEQAMVLTANSYHIMFIGCATF